MTTIEETFDSLCIRAEKLGVHALKLQLHREIMELRESSLVLSPYLDLFSAMVNTAAEKIDNPVTSPSNEALVEVPK